MKKLTVMLLLALVYGVQAKAQPKQTDSVAKAEMAKISFIAGKWAGKGWMYVQGGSKETFEQTENVQIKLDGTVLLVEGLGKAGGKVVHNALAIISWNKDKQQYNFRSYLATGREGMFAAELKGDTFYWYPNQNMRYIIKLNEKGQWFETGEMNREGKWMKFFEMTLDKVN